MTKSIDDRLAWRCRRGLLELDLWLGGFLRTHRATLTVRELAAFERLLQWPDMQILDCLQGRRPEERPSHSRLNQTNTSLSSTSG